MKETLIRARGPFAIANYIFSVIVGLGFDIFYFYFISIMTRDEISLFLIYTIVIVYINIIVYLRINWIYNSKVIFYEDKLIVSALNNKYTSDFFERTFNPFIFGRRGSKKQRIYVLKKEEILYEDIIEYGRNKNLKAKISSAYADDFGIVTNKKKCYIQLAHFSETQLIIIEDMLKQRMKKFCEEIR